MKKIGLIAVLIAFGFSALGQQNLEDELIQLFKSQLKKEQIHNAAIKLCSNTKKINLEWSGGVFKQGDSVSIDHPFYTASIGKTFTATAIGILKDKNQIAFSDPISRYLPKELVQGLHVLNGEDHSNQITIAQLLQHTSGLPDYFEDPTHDGSPNIMTQLFINPTKTWTPIELIQFSKNKMNPLFSPGQGYHYTDTEYVLLGLIVEKISGMPLHEFFKTELFEPLNMKHAYMNLRSVPIEPTKTMTEIYVGPDEVSGFKSLSADWAGGGIVATAHDLYKFQNALFEGELLEDETWQDMQDWTPETQGMYYGFGLRKIVFNELSPDLTHLEVIGHSGSTGSFMYYCPQLDTYVSGTLNQAEAVKNSVILLYQIFNSLLNN